MLSLQEVVKAVCVLSLLFLGQSLLAAELRQLDGAILKPVQVLSISNQAVKFIFQEKEQILPLAQVIGIDFDLPQRNYSKANFIRLKLIDETQLCCHALWFQSDAIHCQLFGGQQIVIPFTQLHQMICEAQDSSNLAAIDELLIKKPKLDIFRVLKRDGTGVNTFEGIVNQPDAEGKRLNVKPDGGDPVAVDVTRLRSLLLAKDNITPGPTAIAKLHDVYGNIFTISELKEETNGLTLKCVAGFSITLQKGTINKYDLTLGKLAYLSDLDPVKATFEPLTSPLSQYRRDKNLEGKPLQVGRQTYQKGLATHSRTLLEFDATGYSTFRTILGIDDLMTGTASALVTIDCDGNELFKSVVSNQNSAKPMDLNLKLGGGKKLRILVDYGDDLDLGDHVLFGDARLLK